MIRIAAFPLALLVCACPVEDPCGEPAFGGAASDESYRTMVDAKDDAEVDETNAPVVTSPEDGASINANGEPPAIAWSSALSASLGPSPLPPPAQRPRAPSIFDRAAELLIPKAYAHLPPVTGDIYLVEISVPGRECPVAGLTTDLEWQLDAESFTPLKESAGAELTLSIISAYLNENRVSEGPYKPAAPVTFSVE